MRDFVRKPWHWVAVVFVIAFLASLIMNVFSASKTNLPSYTTQESDLKQEEEKPEINIDTVEYHSDVINLSMLVPDGWSRVTKSGNDAFINQSDGSMISFGISAYNPTLNAVTQESITQDILNADGAMGAFVQDTPHSYSVIYEIGSTDYFEYNSWDLDTSVRVSMQIPAARYEYYKDILLYLLDTLQWEQENPIPDGFYLYYSDYGSFEFGIPMDWETSLDNGELAVKSPNGSNFRVSLTSTSDDLSGITQLDYSNAMSAGKGGYLLSTFNNSGDTITAESTYSVNGTNYIELHDILATGSFHYEFLFQCPQEAYEQDAGDFLTALNLFRLLS